MSSSASTIEWLRLDPSPTSSLMNPPPKRLSTPAGQRLSVIVEGKPGMAAAQPNLPSTAEEAVPPVPQKSRFRILSAVSMTPITTASTSASTTTTGILNRASVDTLPPEYTRYNYDAGPPSPIEKAETQYASDRIAKRGGWRRLIILLVTLACLAIGLGIGLGIGLRKHEKSSPSDVPGAPASTTAALGFPNGEYSLNTALRTVQTNCTSNRSTWRCYPYSTYSPSSTSSSLTVFDWIISNTSAMYMTGGSLPTTDESGVPANLSISSSDNPFSISFTNKTLTYYNYASQPFFGFSYLMSRQVIPSTALTSDNSASTCFYNNTLLTATLFLSDARNVSYPTSDTSGLGSYESWPFAVRVEQVAKGGADVPACYKTVDGAIGEKITEGFTAKSDMEECLCSYSNFDPE